MKVIRKNMNARVLNKNISNEWRMINDMIDPS